MSAKALTFSEEIEKDVIPWLKIAEDLRSLNLESELNVPQICVMGDQSSGKSSVLNLLAGSIVFPSGTGLVTRCPIRLVMRKARAGEPWSATISTSVNPKKSQVSTVQALNDKIGEATNSLCQGSSNFSTEVVVVELTSPDACDLTVVDLPGIIRTVTAGQSANAIQEVNKLITTYLADKRTIILAVIPANQDIATVDILERAQNVDPVGERTIGVLTKTDLINPGGEDEVLAVVNNVRKPLALGYIMVKNRTQKDLNENMSATEARESEISFFKGHSAFKNCDPALWGVDQLSRRLTSLLVNRIKLQLAPMKVHVEKQLADVRQELRSLSSFTNAQSLSDRQKLLVAVMQEYVRHLTDSVRGEYRDRIMVRHADLRLYTLVLKRFEDFQSKVNTSSPQFKQKGFVENLAAQIEQLRGRELPGFMSSQAFYMCMSQYVDRWTTPLQELLADVRSIAQEVAGRLGDVLLVQYPALRDEIRNVAARVLSDAVDDTLKKLKEVLTREKDPFTMNDFLQQWVNKLRYDKFSDAVDIVFDHAKTPPANWQGLKEEIFGGLRQWYRHTHSVSAQASAQEMSAILEAYWNLSAKRFVDNSCMVVDRELLGHLSSAIQEQMFKFVREDSKLEAFFIEDPSLALQRDRLETRRGRLTSASTALASIQLRSYMPQLPSVGGASSGSSTAGGGGGGRGGADALAAKLQNLTLTVKMGPSGIGLVVTDDDSTGRMMVRDLRQMPGNAPNPSVQAGVHVGDVIEKIDGQVPRNLAEAVTMLKSAKGSVTLAVVRRSP